MVGLLVIVYPTLNAELRRRWDEIEQSLYDELITEQVQSGTLCFLEIRHVIFMKAISPFFFLLLV